MFFSTDDLLNKPDKLLNNILINSKYIEFVEKDSRESNKEYILHVSIRCSFVLWIYYDECKRDAAFEEIKELLKGSHNKQKSKIDSGISDFAFPETKQTKDIYCPTCRHKNTFFIESETEKICCICGRELYF